MIAFDCPHCQKPLIVPNRQAGNRQPCPGCHETLVVPPPPRPSWAARYRTPITYLTVLIVVVLATGWKIYRDREPERIKARLAGILRSQSTLWQGFGWEKCDPQVGEYRFSVFYLGPRKRYVFEVSCFRPADQTFVLVDPAHQQSTWLASLSFTAGETESFRYEGGNDREHEELASLSEQLARAITQAAR